MRKELPVYRMFVDEFDDTGIDLISVVGEPGIEVNFIKLNKEHLAVSLASNQEKQYVTGPVLIPDQLIYRWDPQTNEEYYLTATAQDIEKIRNKFLKSGQLQQSNLEHSAKAKIEGYLIESWIVEDAAKDKSVALGFQDIVPGTLFVTYHFPDPKVWYEVSKRNGFSLEGEFLSQAVKMKHQQDESVESILEQLLRALEG